MFELNDGPFPGVYGKPDGEFGTGTIGMLFDTADGDGKMVAD